MDRLLFTSSLRLTLTNCMKPLLCTSVLVFFLVTSFPSSAWAEQNNAPDGKVVVNGRVLAEPVLQQLTMLYQVRPLPGNYWYDRVSGLYGVVGHSAFGFMLPGHDFGPLPAKASNGNTMVYINGRELPQDEWTIWSMFLGAYIQPGRYWLDGNGYAGYEGNPYPVVNLYQAAQQASMRGQNGWNGNAGGGSSGGDNFWTSRFSAGNYNADNSQGYVSVPGYGPVGYGF